MSHSDRLFRTTIKALICASPLILSACSNNIYGVSMPSGYVNGESLLVHHDRGDDPEVKKYLEKNFDKNYDPNEPLATPVIVEPEIEMAAYPAVEVNEPVLMATPPNRPAQASVQMTSMPKTAPVQDGQPIPLGSYKAPAQSAHNDAAMMPPPIAETAPKSMVSGEWAQVADDLVGDLLSMSGKPSKPVYVTNLANAQAENPALGLGIKQALAKQGISVSDVPGAIPVVLEYDATSLGKDHSGQMLVTAILYGTSGTPKEINKIYTISSM